MADPNLVHKFSYLTTYNYSGQGKHYSQDRKYILVFHCRKDDVQNFMNNKDAWWEQTSLCILGTWSVTKFQCA